MGKSPGKWIKTVLFGKKSSKSNFSKDVNIERKASLAAKAPSSDFSVNPPVVLDPALQTTNKSGNNTEFENGVENLPSSKVTLLPGTQGGDGHGTTILNSADSDELNRQQQAATKAQAAFRGYLARRAFWALKGIIRLQALVRGHLVRRQAVATLQCMQSIVKFQALVRGRIFRLSDAGREVFNKLGEPMDKRVDMLGVNMFLISMNRSTSPFIRKLLASSPTAMPLSLQYDLVEPNSAWNWLERWSSSCFWVPLARPKKIIDAKPKRKQANMQTEEIEATRPKRSVRKVPAINGDSSSLHSSEYEKPRRNPRKVPGHQAESAQEQPQTELEKVKRNLRKVSLSASLPSDKAEPVTEKPQQNQRKASGSPAPDVSVSASLSSDKPEPVTEKPQQNQRKASGSSAPDVSLSAPLPYDKAEPITEKPQKNQRKASGSLAPDVSEEVVDHTTEKLSDSAVALSKQPVTEAPPEPLAVDKPVDIQSDNFPAVELHSLENSEKVENSPKVNEDQNYEEDQTSKENRRTRRRKSLPVKQEYPESVSQNTPTLPSYMQATESAKAKLRAQESLKNGDDEVENGFTRRHSLPASTNVKVNSPSPRMQKPLQANGKGGRKSNRSLTSSRDEKFLQAGWKRR